MRYKIIIKYRHIELKIEKKIDNINTENIYQKKNSMRNIYEHDITEKKRNERWKLKIQNNKNKTFKKNKRESTEQGNEIKTRKGQINK